MASSIIGAGSTWEDSLLFNAIKTNNVSSMVIARDKKFQKLTSIIDVIAKKNVVAVRSGARYITLPYLPDLAISAQIKTGGRNAVGNGLQLDWQDPEYDGFINGRLVEAKNGTWGTVTAHGNGYIQIALFYSITGDTTFQTADFAAGEQVSQAGDVSKGVHGARESIKYVPQDNFNVIGSERYTLELTEEDMARQTVVTVNGKPYWQTAAEELWLQETLNTQNVDLWKRPYRNVTDAWSSGGFKWQLQNQDGQLETYDGNLSEAFIYSIFETVLARGTGSTEFFVPCGYALQSGFQQTIGSKYIQYAGINNTIGGKTVEGINVMEFKALGISLKLFNWDVLNNPALNPEGLSVTGKPKSAYTGIFLDTSDVMTVGHGMQPFISKYYYGQQESNTQKFDGMTDITGAKAKMPVSKINSASIEMDINCCTQLNDPSRHILLTISQ